jgi:hypothetical protein
LTDHNKRCHNFSRSEVRARWRQVTIAASSRMAVLPSDARIVRDR